MLAMLNYYAKQVEAVILRYNWFICLLMSKDRINFVYLKYTGIFEKLRTRHKDIKLTKTRYYTLINAVTRYYSMLHVSVSV